MLRSFFLFAVIVLRIRFVKFCFVKQVFFLREYPDTHKKMTISFPCIRLFVFVARIAPPRGIAICVFLNTCVNTQMPKIAVFLSKICHFDIALLRFCWPLQLLQWWWQRDSVACAIAAARMLRRWRQRDRAMLAAA